MNQSAGPRIYNLFPRLVGGPEAWRNHLVRIRDMGFDWVFLNPVQYAGFSGSLYAIKEHYRLHAMFETGENEPDYDTAIQGFCRAAREQGLKVMFDIVANHVSKDSPLIREHPEWFVWQEDGNVKSPFAVDPDDPGKVTVWEDLAMVNWEDPNAAAGLSDWWARWVGHHVGLGIDGFRCDAAYQMPGAVWKRLIRAGRAVRSDVVFAAETLGCGPEQVEALAPAGFDFLFNSSKWWDFHASWLLEQYERFRHIGPSIAFPESHDTARLVSDLPGDWPVEALYRQRYLFACTFSTGVMMPIGYEWGFGRELDVVHMTPDDWEERRFDLSGFVAEANYMKEGLAPLNEEGPQRRLDFPDGRVVGLLRRCRRSTGEWVLTLINTHPFEKAEVHVADIKGINPDEGVEVTPQRTAASMAGVERLQVAPAGVRVFACPGPGGR